MNEKFIFIFVLLAISHGISTYAMFRIEKLEERVDKLEGLKNEH